MYTIVKQRDGTYRCLGRLQDGTEVWEEPALAEAINSLKQFAEVMNHDPRLTAAGISYYREVEVLRITTECEPWSPRPGDLNALPPAPEGG